jgi:NAD+ kinase
VQHLLQLEDRLPLDCRLHSDLEKEFRKHSDKKIRKRHFLPTEEFVKDVDIVVAFGGDGTMLNAARIVGSTGIPIVGINLGKLGFMAEISVDELESFIRDILNDKHIIEDRSILSITAEKDKQPMYALNEVVIDKSNSSRLIHISVYVNNDYLVSYPGDGIIVSTPTGSTGYALAAGGPIVVPTTDVFIIQPISPHSLSARTVVVPDSSSLRIVVEHVSDRARITADGQQEKIMKPPVNIFVEKADHTIRLVKRKDRTYYDILRAKLFWGSDIRLIKGKSE